MNIDKALETKGEFQVACYNKKKAHNTIDT